MQSYTNCIGHVLSNPDPTGSNAEIDREGAKEPTRPPFSQLRYNKGQFRKVPKIELNDKELIKSPLKNFFHKARTANKLKSPSKGTFSEQSSDMGTPKSRSNKFKGKDNFSLLGIPS